MVDSTILEFTEQRGTSKQNWRVPLATHNPYDAKTSPADILQFLPPDGSMFSLFNDPYARMSYYMPKAGNHKAKYWLESRLQEHSFTDNELKLIHFLTEHRCATRSQIKRAIFKVCDNNDKIKDFLGKCHDRGIISAFSWGSPCVSERKKPLVYGLTRVGCQAAEFLYHARVPKNFIFQAVQFPLGTAPKMNTFFPYLAANELYCQLKVVDRVVKWEREPTILLNDQTTFRPQFVAEVIREAGELKTLWIEVVRVFNGWYEHTMNHFRTIQHALEHMPEHSRPARILILADSDSRIPILSALAEEHMPDGVIRFTTDERLLSTWNEESLVQCQPDGNLIGSPIPFLLPNWDGMTASEYLEQQTVVFDEDFDDM